MVYDLASLARRAGCKPAGHPHAGADGFEPGDKAEVRPGQRGFDSPGLHHPKRGWHVFRSRQSRPEVSDGPRAAPMRAELLRWV